MQRQFEQGVHTDMVIRVRVGEPQPPAAKRKRVSKAAAAAAAAAADADRFTDIKAHSVVLSARSDYVEACLRGEWAEAAERRVELTVPDEQALEDLRLLIKLSYSASYTYEGEQLLPLATRLQLAVRADAPEFVQAVEAVVESLAEGFDFEAAQALMDDLPPVVEAHPGMAAVRREIVAVLVEGIEEPEEKEEEAAAVESAVDALAKCRAPWRACLRRQMI